MQTTPDLANSQRTTELVLPLDKEHAIGQSLPSGACRSHEYRFPIIVLDKLVRDSKIWIRTEVRPKIDQLNTISKHEVDLSGSLIPIDEIRVGIPSNAVDLTKGCYILILSNAEPGLLGMTASQKDSYLDGSLYLDGVQEQGDLTFYSYSHLSLQQLGDRALRVLPFFLKLIFLTLVFSLFGFSILVLVGENTSWDQGLAMFTSLICGMAVLVSSLVLFSIFKIPYRLITLIFCFVVIGIGLAIKYRIFHKEYLHRIEPTQISIGNAIKNRINRVCVADFWVLGLFLLALAVRVLQTAELSYPAWVDGLTHASLLRTIDLTGRISLDQDYQLGFHILSYLNRLMTGWNIPTAILLTGQWLSAITGLGLYWFIARILHRKDAAVIGAILFWFYSPFPQYVTNWSRFPFLLGLVISFSILIQSKTWIEGNNYRPFLFAICFFSLAVSHYASFVFVIIVLISWVLVMRDRFSRLFEQAKLIPYKSSSLILALVLIIPTIFMLVFRFVNMYGKGAISLILRENQRLAGELDSMYFLDLAVKHGGTIVILLGLLGGILLFIKSRHSFWAINGWIILMIGITGLQLVVWGGSFPSVTNFFIWLFIPLTALGGFGIAICREKFIVDLNLVQRKSITIFISLVFILCGVYSSIGFVNPKTILAGSTDKEAIYWASNHINSGSVFFINSFPWGADFKPSDGGGWLSYTNDFEIRFPRTEEERNDLYGFIQKNGIQYYYKGKSSFLNEVDPLLTSGLRFDLIYEKDGVEIYHLLN